MISAVRVVPTPIAASPIAAATYRHMLLAGIRPADNLGFWVESGV